MKRLLLLGRKALTNLDSVLKSRDITLPTKVHIVKAMVFCGSHAWMWDFFLDSKITVDGDWSHEIRRRLLLGRKAMTNIDSVLKSRDITLPTNVHIVVAWSSHWSHTVVRPGPWRRQSTKEFMTSNCGAGEDFQKSLGPQEIQTSQS